MKRTDNPQQGQAAETFRAELEELGATIDDLVHRYVALELAAEAAGAIPVAEETPTPEPTGCRRCGDVDPERDGLCIQCKEPGRWADVPFVGGAGGSPPDRPEAVARSGAARPLEIAPSVAATDPPRDSATPAPLDAAVRLALRIAWIFGAYEQARSGAPRLAHAVRELAAAPEDLERAFELATAELAGAGVEPAHIAELLELADQTGIQLEVPIEVAVDEILEAVLDSRPGEVAIDWPRGDFAPGTTPVTAVAGCTIDDPILELRPDLGDRRELEELVRKGVISVRVLVGVRRFDISPWAWDAGRLEVHLEEPIRIGATVAVLVENRLLEHPFPIALRIREGS